VQAAPDFPQIEAAFGVHYEQRCGTRSHLYPSVRETLQALRAQGVKLVVMTNKEGRYTRVVLDAHQLAPLFDSVISGDSLPVKKPNPAGIVECLQQFGVSSDRALFVGDSSIDVATARNAGITVWALPYGYNMGQPIESCHPDRVIPDLSALTTQPPFRAAAAGA
jgi:phosphoglycolate phosphatase